MALFITLLVLSFISLCFGWGFFFTDSYRASTMGLLGASVKFNRLLYVPFYIIYLEIRKVRVKINVESNRHMKFENMTPTEIKQKTINVIDSMRDLYSYQRRELKEKIEKQLQ